MADDAVEYEPVSWEKFPITGKIIGNSSKMARIDAKPAVIELSAQDLTSKFPLIQKWEFLHGYLGIEGARIYVKRESRNPESAAG